VQSDELYVQYGCGFSAPEGWLNFDASPTLRFEKLPLIGKLYTKNSKRFPRNVYYGDVVKGLPIESGTAVAVYCSHVLEHLALDEFRAAMKETYRILQNGGTFRFVLPDFELFAKQYSNDPSPDALFTFMKGTSLGREKANTSLKSFILAWLGKSDHQWMWDYKAIQKELTQVGFCDIRRRHYGDSDNPVYNAVEDKERWENCLGVECKKIGSERGSTRDV